MAERGATPTGASHTMKMGLGEAIQRLVDVRQALNQYELDLAFDCDRDGVPDTVEIFEESAQTGCCRILPLGMTGATRRRRTSRGRPTTSRGPISRKR